MASINFSLNHQKKDSKGLIPVWMVLNFNGIRIRKATKAKLKEKHWIEKTQRIKPPLKGEPYNNHAEFNTILDSTEKKVQDIFNHALLNGIPLTKEYVESQLNNNFSAQPKAKDFFTCFEEFIEANKPLKAKRTIMGYVTTVNFLKGFQNDSNLPIRFDNVSLDWFDKLRTYAFKEKQVKDNYFSTLINRLKAFLGWATDRGYNENQAFKKFSTIEREGDIICLYEKELFQLYEFEFKSKRLEQVRDVYCFGCFTGLRFSDLFDLGREHIRNGEIQKTIIKTRQFQKIPLNNFALAILNKYQDYPNPLPLISAQKFNSYIKEVCQLAGIDELITVTSYSGGKAIEKTVPKYELITSHTARKTFTTNSLIFGLNESIVKKLTGHKKDKNFQRYVKFADEYLKEESNTAWNKRK